MDTALKPLSESLHVHRQDARAGVRRGWRVGVQSVLLALIVQASPASADTSAQPVPKRIVSLLPSATEAVCALGRCADLVGVDVFSQDPPSVRQLPQLGKPFQPDLEGIVRLRPDVVLTGRSPAVQQRLRSMGVRVVEVDAETVPEVKAMLGQIDALLQTRQADVVWSGLQQRLQKLADGVAAQRSRVKADAAPAESAPPSKTRVYLEVDAAMYAAGPHSFMGQLLTMLGADNILPATGPAFPRMTPEWVVRQDPDLIIQTYSSHLKALKMRPGWTQMRALREERVCVLSMTESRVVTRPGPNLDKAAAVLARCLRGEKQPLNDAQLESSL